MQYEVKFGSLNGRPRPAAAGAKFRLALLGDFSGRANAGTVETGAALARRKPVKVDVDNLDDVVARLAPALSLTLAGDGDAVAVRFAGIDDFHPDALAENLEIFGQLRALRRDLSSRGGFDRAARQVLSWSGAAPLPPVPRRARGTAVAVDSKLSDFARLIGRPAAARVAEASVDDLVRRLVGPFIVPDRDARQEQLVARVDEALSAAMRRVLHYPDFQAAEAMWRGVEFLVRRIETGARMEIVLHDVSAEELAADLAGTDALEQTGLYGLLVEQPALDAHQGALSAVIGLHAFELTPPHADLLGRMARIAAGAGAPFIAGIGPDALTLPFHDQHPLIREAWSALQALPEAAYLGLATPHFLLRMPYGKKTDPIDAFGFEEFTRQEGLGGMLWGHPALLVGLLLAQTWARQGVKMTPGSMMGVGDMPYYVYVDAEGEQVALPCTERLYSERQAVQVANYRVMPVLSLRGRPEVRLGSFTSLAGTPLAGFWAPVDYKPAAPAAAALPLPAETPAPVPPAATEPAPDKAAMTDLDALLASLSEPTPGDVPQAPPAPASAEPAPPEPAAEGDADELDKLLASLSADPPAAAPDATEAELDALLASLQ